MYMSAVVVVYVDAGKIQNHRTQRKQVAHQIPTSGRDGGDQTHETTAEDVLRCGALIGTRGVWFGGGGGVFLLPDKSQTLRICLLCSSIFHTFFAPTTTSTKTFLASFASRIFHLFTSVSTPADAYMAHLRARYPTNPWVAEPNGPHLHPWLSLTLVCLLLRKSVQDKCLMNLLIIPSPHCPCIRNCQSQSVLWSGVCPERITWVEQTNPSNLTGNTKCYPTVLKFDWWTVQ